MSNRTTAKSNIITKNVPTVTNAIMTDMLNNELAENVVFREDVAVVQSSGASNITVDFSGKDRVDLTRTGGSLNITLSGISDGEIKYLLIAKTTGQAVTFVGVTDITPIKANANALSLVLYEIVRKSSFYFAKAWVENVKTATDTIEGVLETATAAESNALSVVNKIVTPGRIPIASTSQKGISELATAAEGNALSDTTRPITPGTIPTASTTQKGVIEVATAAQNDAGTAGTLAVIASELKRKYDALVALFNTATTLSLSSSPHAPFTVTSINGRRSGAVITVHAQVSASAPTGLKFIKHIDGYVSPGYVVPFVAAHDDELVNDGGWGYIDTLGDIYMAAGYAGVWRFTAVSISS